MRGTQILSVWALPLLPGFGNLLSNKIQQNDGAVLSTNIACDFNEIKSFIGEGDNMNRMGNRPKLSKSKFLAGCQCLKRLYLKVHEPETAPEPDEVQQAQFDQGHAVGVLATKAFPAGVAVEDDYLHHTEAVARTQDLMKDKNVPAIFEAAFTYQDVRVRVDILERLPRNRWRFFEVKSTAKLKDTHYDDVAIQKYVLEGCGLKLSESCLMHLNRDYVYNGRKYDLGKLYVINDLTKDVRDLIKKIPSLLAKQKRILRLPEPPDIQPGDHCKDP